MISFPIYVDNLISWLIQVSLIATLGAVLPLLFRIRHPRTQLAYCHTVLAICILLPFVEPWQHPLLLAAGGSAKGAAPASGISLTMILGWIIAIGILARLGWLASGLIQIRRYRAAALPIFPIPDSILRARELSQSDARFGISHHVDGPATMGYLDPIVLLPESFPSLDHDAQLSIACHELLHVKRNDWLVTLTEEIVASAFWFHPAIWWLLSQAKLSREQFVDSEVVSLTSAPAPYVQALLVMAGAAKGLKTIPAASFLTEGHLPRRVRALLTKRSGSVARLFLSYGSIAVLLLVLGWSAMLWFPLIGKAETIEAISRTRVLPPTLVPWRKAPVPAGTLRTFNVHVAAPPKSSGDVLYFRGGIVGGPASGEETLLSPPPPPPPPPPPFLQQFGGLGVRMLRPGDRVTPEEIARLQAALGDRTVLEVTQTEDGTIRRVTVLGRRIPDEISNGHFIFGLSSDGGISAGTAGSTDSTDGIH